ncbi:hypothetical protein BS17DRAFT_794414 [Gyrodon lividus]|nr:hypothetical protein BS17DRAFT_794414 [Gyrodon lividus]
MGRDFLGVALDNNNILITSLDSMQIYQDKESNSWLYIWILVNIHLDKQYCKLQVLPGGFIPGPKKPKNLDSFLNSCRIYCGVLGHQKTRQTHYYPALLKLCDHTCAGSNHPDYNAFKIPLGGSGDYATNLRQLLSAPNQSQFEARHMEMGITKTPLILGLKPLHSPGVPICMTTDIMHLAGNISDLLISLWCRTITCAPSDNINTWNGDSGHHFTGSFDTKPCNLAEKINTDYKTWEFQLYMFGLGPALLYNILPQ